MKAMVFHQANVPLALEHLPLPIVGEDQVLLKVIACGICRTDLHILDGELKFPKKNLIPGHQVVAKVIKLGAQVKGLKLGQRVGVPWLGQSCQCCYFCHHQQENLCEKAQYTGYQINGGFAQYCVAHAHFCFDLPESYEATQVAPLLCAGLIGFRAYRKIPGALRIGFYGFGASAHILCQVAKYNRQSVYAFTRPHDTKNQEFARTLGAVWAGDSDQLPPVPLDAAIIFAPDGHLVPQALKSVRKGGVVVCAGIHMTDIPGFPYCDLWGERKLESVANLTRQDGIDFLALAPKIPVKTKVTCYPLEKVNDALSDLRAGRFSGAGVITL